MRSAPNYPPKVPPATIASIGFAYFVIAVIALRFLNPAYGLIRSFLGTYDLGSYEFLIASTFFSLGLGSLALVIGLYQRMPRSAGAWIGLVFLGIWSLGIFVAGIFPANEAGSTVPHMTTALIAGIFPVEVEAYPETTFSFIHILSILGALFSLSLAAILLSWGCRHEDKRRFIHYLSSILSLAMMAGSILLFQGIFLNLREEISELSSKILTFSSLLWLFLTAARLQFPVAGLFQNDKKDTG